MNYLASNSKNSVLMTGVVMVREDRGRERWLLVKQSEIGGWEFCKSLVRKGESSVRTAIRVMNERGGMSTRVLEEAGRVNGMSSSGGKEIKQKIIYYLMLLRSSPKEIIGFQDYCWGDYSQALKKLASKKEKAILIQARQVFKTWKKNKKAKFEAQEREEFLEQMMEEEAGLN